MSATTADEVQENKKRTFSAWAGRLRESDKTAYAELFKEMSAKLVRYAKTIVRDEAAAYDVLQDVFLKLWEKRGTLNPESSLQSLLYTMTRNASLNVQRKQSYLVHADYLPDEVDVRQGTGNSVEIEIDAQDLSVRLNWWIEELPDRRREAFVLSRHYELSHKEISDIMGLSERTVNTHIFLALKHLRSRLDQYKND